MAILFLFFSFAAAQDLVCQPGWTEFQNQCYKHFNTPNERLLMPAIREKCATFGGDIATGGKKEERQFLEMLNRASFNGTPQEMDMPGEGLLLGMGSRTAVESMVWDPVHGPIDRPLPFCYFSHMLQPRPRKCLVHRTFPARNWCFQFISCLGSGAQGFRRYVCVAPKKAHVVCSDKNTVEKDGKCVCKEGYIDVKESDRNYKEVVDFVKSGAQLIPNIVNVGFIKFSTNVSFAKWLPTRWSTRDFQQMVPTDFDAGYTNTPAAIHKAIEMFDEDGSHDKMTVLITDGLPVPDGETDKLKALSDTEDAIAKLRLKRIKLVALGFGPELKQQNGYSYMKKWLEDPEEDYFSFDKMACDLKSVHMQILLQKACRRYI